MSTPANGPAQGGRPVAAPTEAASASSAPTEQANDDPVVQYVVVRRDLLDTWSTGSVMAQAVHASVAAIWAHRGDGTVAGYCGGDAQMRTVVLEASDEAAVQRLSGRLTAAGVAHEVWREQPEDEVTALAARPYARSEVRRHFKGLRLFR